MSKKQDLKRKAQLSVKARMESFRFQVTWEKNQKMPEIPDEALQVELDALCEKGLVEEIFTLRDIVEGARKELGYQTEAGKRFIGRDDYTFFVRDNYNLSESE